MFSWIKKLKTELAIPIAIVAALAVGGPIVAVNIEGDDNIVTPPKAADSIIISDGFGVGLIDLDGDTLVVEPVDIVVTP